MDPFTDSPRMRSDSMSSSLSQGSRSKVVLRQRLTRLLTCIEDMRSDDEASEEVSRTLDEALHLCGRFVPTDAFRSTRSHASSYQKIKENVDVEKSRCGLELTAYCRVCYRVKVKNKLEFIGQDLNSLFSRFIICRPPIAEDNNFETYVFTTRQMQECNRFVNIFNFFHPFWSNVLVMKHRQAAHSDLERGHGGAP